MWLYVPTQKTMNSAGSAFVPASADSISEFASRFPSIELFVLSSEKVLQRPLSWRGWKTRAFIQRLFGTISDPLMAAHGVEKFISSLPDILANPFRFRVNAKANTTPAISGQKSAESSTKSNQNSSSVKTSPAICPLASKTSSETFKKWAMSLQRASYQRRKSAQRTPEKGSSFWPTPTFKSGGNRACIKASPAGLLFQSNLNQTGAQIGLRNAALAWTLMWDLLTAAGWEPRPFPSSHRHRVILLNGEKYSTDNLTLNPQLKDWLMGWPIGWSEPLRPVTGWSQWLLRARLGI